MCRCVPLVSVLNLSSAPMAQHPPTERFSLDGLTDTTGTATTNCCSSQPPPSPLLTALGTGEGGCPRHRLFTGMGAGCLSSPQSRSCSAGLVKSGTGGLSPLGLGIRCGLARTRTLTLGWVAAVSAGAVCAGRASSGVLLQEVSLQAAGSSVSKYYSHINTHTH